MRFSKLELQPHCIPHRHIPFLPACLDSLQLQLLLASQIFEQGKSPLLPEPATAMASATNRADVCLFMGTLASACSILEVENLCSLLTIRGASGEEVSRSSEPPHRAQLHTMSRHARTQGPTHRRASSVARKHAIAKH